MKTMRVKFGSSFDWFDVLEGLANGEKVDQQTYSKLREMAADWPTCACGQLCVKLPRDHNVPKDEKVRQLGVKFADFVDNQNWVKALHCFNQIEGRTAELLGIPLVSRHPQQQSFAAQMAIAAHFPHPRQHA
jgi:hypothetical protein